MSTYVAQEGVYVGAPPCASCGAALRLHTVPAGTITEAVPIRVGPNTRQYLTSLGLQKLLAAGAQLQCPEAYRPGTLEEAQRGLAAAEASGDAARIFIARGELQRLQGRP